MITKTVQGQMELSETSTKPIHVISLGAGVQSSTMALMAAYGFITPMPHCAIFADTQAEPQSVYKWLDWLEERLPFPLYRVTQGDGLVADALKIRDTIRCGGCGSRITSSVCEQCGSKEAVVVGKWSPSGVPHFNRNENGTYGHGPRQCTGDFKIAPIMRKIRMLIKEAGATHAVQWIGISLDEAHRMKPSRVKYATSIWPLIDRRMSRHDCLLWMHKRGFPKPPRSACVFCPYHSDAEWRRLRDEEPEEFIKAVKFERDYQAAKAVGKLRMVPFLHRSCVPLDQVDFSTDEDRGQTSLFGNECEGMCGV